MGEEEGKIYAPPRCGRGMKECAFMDETGRDADQG